MSFKIPIWCIPWQARAELARYESQRVALLAELAIERASHKETVQQKIGVEMTVEENKVVESKNKHAISALLAWIYATHKIDQRATEHGLTDILKDFPRK